MKNENTIVEPKRRFKKVLKALLYGGLEVAALLLAAHLLWKYSGSNEWKLLVDRNGVKIYELKAPGSTLKQFKVVTHVKTTLNHSIAPMVLTDLATCAEWVPGCDSMEVIEHWNPQEMNSWWMWGIDAPFPFSRREFLLRTQVTPEPQNNAVRVDNVAFPDKLPRNPCCFRVTDMHNTWRYTSLGNGEVEVELVQHMDPGIPYFLFNRMAVGGLYEMFSKMPVLLNEEKYQNVRFEFIDAMAARKTDVVHALRPIALPASNASE